MQKVQLLNNEWYTMSRKSQMVGSQTIEGAATAGSDVDWLILVWSKHYAVRNAAKSGFHLSSNIHLNLGPYTASMWETKFHPKFVSLVDQDNTNLIITSSWKFYHKFAAANDLAVKLKLTDKQDRIALFQYILYGNLTA
jgi:hypothetical protein